MLEGQNEEGGGKEESTEREQGDTHDFGTMSRAGVLADFVKNRSPPFNGFR